MVKVKSPEETSENYYISTRLGMWNTMRYWKEKGFTKEDAMKKAVDYGVGMVRDIKEREKPGRIFKDIGAACNSLGDILIKCARQPFL